MSAIEANDSGVTPRAWAQALALAPYRGASAARGVFELAVTAIPFVVLWAAMLLASGADHIGSPC